MLSLPEALARRILQVTEPLWSAPPTNDAEPMHEAWKRVFGVPMDLPLALQAVDYEGRLIAMRLHGQGRVAVIDPLSGSQIRVLKKLDDGALHVTSALVHGGKGARPMTGAYEDARMGHAAVRFLQQAT